MTQPLDDFVIDLRLGERTDLPRPKATIDSQGNENTFDWSCVLQRMPTSLSVKVRFFTLPETLLANHSIFMRGKR